MPGTHKLSELLVITSNRLNCSGCLLPKLPKLHGVFKSPVGSQTTRGASDSRFASVYGEWNRIAFWTTKPHGDFYLGLCSSFTFGVQKLVWPTSCQRDFGGVLPEASGRLSAAEPAEVPAPAQGLADQLEFHGGVGRVHAITRKFPERMSTAHLESGQYGVSFQLSLR
ncbi:hypothetical protein BD779DRAFT_1479163 [Infundibulicybe gibba]|nr:hypothetical protein BD779DRAFT_1479163 [Infundibulicybe gibba]